jgi:diguanylate cyclase (GGDEF)-like protein
MSASSQRPEPYANGDGTWRIDWPAVLAGQGVVGTARAVQLRLTAARARGLCEVVALLVLAWIPIDLLGLGNAPGAALIATRVGLALLLLALAQVQRRSAARMPAALVLGACFVLQALGYAALRSLVPDDAGLLLRLGYGLLPFLLVAQLAIFPLPVFRSVLLVLPALALQAWPGNLVEMQTPTVYWGGIWLVLLIGAMAAWAGAAQLDLLLGLLQARREAAQDALTGLASRRVAARRLEAEFARAQRTGISLSVLMLDLDHFKRINDHHGHAEGDRVLVSFAARLRDELRGVDLAARYGGEEFLAILPGADAAQAARAAERVRARTAVVDEEDPLAPPAVTVSIGIATWRPGDTPEALVARADAALYRAKDGGRNRCVADAG